MSLRTYSHQLAALDAKAVKAWLQDASWKGRANKNNPRFYADVPADDSGPFAAIRKAIIDAINKAERKKRQKGKKVGRCARWVLDEASLTGAQQGQRAMHPSNVVAMSKDVAMHAVGEEGQQSCGLRALELIT
ncbi:hypothetical protein CHLRE_16g682001v5 [Chlamydomonas reinhardtii]|uniref:Uncharacterized protein n=1 Tax=Chlamydomonas reinhardtii TaxID=3055 RepID=A0A2K3CV16_CHLRE|nr:uncharacterized protein CHLRE_16g682001v5 [Chlamydomonas reinhardtii]PNW72114.1 hypothetical protein CHLRE_16g682001v5 [Chlamydomonas reinhardtii]